MSGFGQCFDLAEREGRGDRHRCDHSVAIRLEQVRAHTRDIADIVTDVVRNHTRITWIILRDTCFHLAD